MAGLSSEISCDVGLYNRICVEECTPKVPAAWQRRSTVMVVIILFHRMVLLNL